MRGFRESRLGPKDQFGNPYGGNMRIAQPERADLPDAGQVAQTARVSAFFDMGGVYETSNRIKFFGPDGVTPADYQFRGWSSTEALGGRRRAVAGAARALPVQPRRALNAKHGDGITTWGDETEGFQFSVGQAF